MFKKLFLVFIFLIGFVSLAQNSKLLDSLKGQDNFEEYVYVHLDEFSVEPSISNFFIFKNLENSLWRKPITISEQVAQLYFYVNYAYQLKQFGAIYESVVYYEKAFDFYSKNSIQAFDIVEYCLKPLANNYTRLGDTDRAEDILKISIDWAEKENNTQQLISGYSNLATVLRTKGALNLANTYLSLGLKLADSKLGKAKIYSNLAMNYLLLDSLQTSVKMLQLSNDLNAENLESLLISNSKILGGVFYKQGKYDKALIAFEKALEGVENRREEAKIFNQIGDCYVGLNKFEKALVIYQKALIVLMPNFKPINNLQNPINEYLYPENTLKESFDGRAITFAKLEKFEESLRCYDLSFLIEDELRGTYVTQNSKLLQQQENRDRTERCIDVCYQLFENTSNNKWLEKAFLYAEKTKSKVLLESKENLLTTSSLKNEKLFKEEKVLNFRKSQLNKEITVEQLKGDSANVNSLANLTKERDAVFREIQLLKQKIKTKYPVLSIANDSVVSVQKIQKELLNEETSLIEFFDGKSHLYIFKILKNKQVEVKRIEKTETFKNDLLTFLSFFSDGRGSALQNNITNYTAIGFQLFEQLFQSKFTKNTILIPDGLFSFLPFDALLTKETTISNFGKLNYLIHQSTISYAYSASILLNEKSQFKNTSKEVLGFFPVFENNHRNLSVLNYTVNEAEKIENQMSGEIFIGEKATKLEFNKSNQKFPIIHLSTHASAGDYYTPATIEFYNETLYLPEIYGYNFNTDLLVLSACETGIGALIKGEGVLSLARGFSYAGVKNLIVSLWKVNDKATEKLMTGFYKNYVNLDNKSLALQQSKLDYLKNEDIAVNKKSPYYWASFVYIGEIKPSSTTNFSYYCFLLVVLAVVVIIFVYKNSRFDSK